MYFRVSPPLFIVSLKSPAGCGGEAQPPAATDVGVSAGVAVDPVPSWEALEPLVQAKAIPAISAIARNRAGIDAW